MARTDPSAETKSRASARMAGLASTATVRNSIAFLSLGSLACSHAPTHAPCLRLLFSFLYSRLLVLSRLLGVIRYIVCASDRVCDSLVPTGKNGTCYQGGLTVYENFQQCDVTSKSPQNKKNRSSVSMEGLVMQTLETRLCYLTIPHQNAFSQLTDRKILDTLGPDQPPAITFSCNQQNKTCDFQCRRTLLLICKCACL